MPILDRTNWPSAEPVNIAAPDGHYSGIHESGCLVFKGIYYAEARRFEAPVLVSGRQLGQFGPRCPQDGGAAASISEDCLHLNLFRPLEAERCPVLVYVHGGSFMRGGNNDKSTLGHTLAREKQVIVVNVNYRLGLFGFLDFSAYGDQYAGNPGLSDVLAALVFVKRNIAAFGGDPDNITLMGESAGGSITAALAAHIEEPLFHKTILSSPIPSSFVDKAESLARSEQFLRFVGARGPEELEPLDAAFLAPLSRRFADAVGLGVTTFRPGIDGTVLRDFPIARFRKKKVVARPTLVGVTGDEMSILNYGPFARLWNLDTFIDQGLARERAGFGEEMTALYEEVFGEKEARTQLYSDTVVRLAAVWYARAAAAVQPTWLYRFDYATPLFRGLGLRAFHTIDLYFIFANLPKTMRHPFNLAVQKEIQHDFACFLHDGRLPWPQITGRSVPARAYGHQEDVRQILPATCLDFWDTSHYKRDCHRSIDDGDDGTC